LHSLRPLPEETPCARKPKTATDGTALANVEVAAPPARQITRSKANAMLKSRALELYHEARTRREKHIRVFEAEYGRVDRLDHTILADPRRGSPRSPLANSAEARLAANPKSRSRSKCLVSSSSERSPT
jgi:hypothetical protein